MQTYDRDIVPAAFRRLFTAQSIPEATPEQSRAFNDLMPAAGGSKGSVNILRALYEVDVRNIAAKVQCPTLVLHPSHNFRVPYEEGRSLAALIPKARFVPLNSRNAIMLDHEAAWTELASELRALLTAPKESATPVHDLPIGELTGREREVLEMVALGFNNGQIAKKLCISENTVRNHVSMLLAREAGFGRHTPE